MERLKILVTRQWPEEALAAAAARYDLTVHGDEQPLDRAALADAFQHYDILCPTITDRIDAALLANPGRTKAICSIGAGVNHIDLDAARAAGLIVTNTPDVTTDETADIAILLMMMCARRASEGERLLRSGEWTGWAPMQLLGQRLRGRTLGIVGFGRIGRAVAERASAGLGMRIRYASRSASADAARMGIERCELDALFAEADVISLHVPGGAETRGLVDARRLALMQPHAILVNTARGDLIDEAALIAALTERRLFAAGLDVYQDEPAVPAALQGLPNAVLLPHLGSATRETRGDMALRALANVAAIAAGHEPPDRVA